MSSLSFLILLICILCQFLFLAWLATLILLIFWLSKLLVSLIFLCWFPIPVLIFISFLVLRLDLFGFLFLVSSGECSDHADSRCLQVYGSKEMGFKEKPWMLRMHKAQYCGCLTHFSLRASLNLLSCVVCVCPGLQICDSEVSFGFFEFMFFIYYLLTTLGQNCVW
jgi:hypothetical protein